MPNNEYPSTANEPVAPTNTIVEIQSPAVFVPEDMKFKKVPVQNRCHHCNQEIFTRVRDEVNKDGICWAIFCYFCGSGIVSIIILRGCMDGFNVYQHVCPTCNSIIGRYNPKLSGGAICCLFLPVILIVALILLIFL